MAKNSIITRELVKNGIDKFDTNKIDIHSGPDALQRRLITRIVGVCNLISNTPG